MLHRLHRLSHASCTARTPLTRINSFHVFFNQIDTFKSDYFLWVTAGGLENVKQRVGVRESIPQELEAELGDEGDDAEGEEG